MHATAAFQGALSTVSTLAHKLGMLSPTSEGFLDTVRRPTSARRRYGHVASTTNPLLETETDPWAVAATVAVAITQADGPLTAESKAELCAEFKSVFGLREGVNLLAYGCWLAKDYRDPIAICDCAAPYLKSQLWLNQKQDLLDMLARLSSGAPDQVRALGRLKMKLGL